MFKRKIFPKSISSRFNLIILCPILIIQCVSIYFFINRHLSDISKTLAYNIIKQINAVVDLFDNNQLHRGNEQNNFYLFSVKQVDSFPEQQRIKNIPTKMFKHFIKEKMRWKYSIMFKEPNILLYIKANSGNLLFLIPRKQVFSSTNTIFLWLNLIFSLMILLIAKLFLKNQLKPIITLSKRMNSITNFGNKPSFLTLSGADEVRDLIKAFNKTISKIHQFFAQRSTMLAGISHDLKTHLTRIKLQTEMINDEGAEALKLDIKEMEKMLNEFLEFSKNQYIESTRENLNLETFFNNITIKIKNLYSLKFSCNVQKNISIFTNKKALERCVMNIINNSSRYSKKVELTCTQVEDYIDIVIEDNGPGFSKEMLNDVIPFYKSDISRNLKSDVGSGLGLAIVRNIISNLGGSIVLGKSKMLFGALVRIKLYKNEN